MSLPRQPRCSVVVFGVLLGLRLVRSWPAGVGSPASPGGAQLPRMAAVRGRFMALGEQAEQQPLQSTQEQAHNQLKSFVLGQPGRAPRQPRGGREGGVCSPTSCSQPSRSSWDSRGGRRVSQGAGARAGSAALHPAANQVVRPGTAGAGAASAKGRARGALMGGSPVSPAIKSFVLGQPGRARPATGLVMQGLRHPYLSIYLLDNCTKYIQ